MFDKTFFQGRCLRRKRRNKISFYLFESWIQEIRKLPKDLRRRVRSHAEDIRHNHDHRSAARMWRTQIRTSAITRRTLWDR